MAKIHIAYAAIFIAVFFQEVITQSCTTYNTDTTDNDYDAWIPWIPELTGGERLHFKVKGADTIKIALAPEPKLDQENYYVYDGITEDKAGGSSQDDASIYRSSSATITSEPLTATDSSLLSSTASFTDLELSYVESGGVGVLALGPKDFTLPTVSYMDSSPLGIVWIGLDSATTAAEWQICDPVPKLISGTGLGSSSLTGSTATEARDAYDGEISSSSANCAISSNANNPQWRFAFSGNTEKIISLVVIHRRDSGGSAANRKLEGTEIWVGSISCRSNQCGADITSTEDAYTAGCPITKTCSNTLVGDSITIRRPENSVVLTLCEVEIYGLDVTQAVQSKLYLSAPVYYVLESESVDIVVTRDIVAESTCSLARITTTQDTATTGSDYTAISQNSPTFSLNDLSEFRTLTTMQDDTYEGDERLTVTLSNVRGGYFGTPITAEIVIEDDDAEYYFCQDKYIILESNTNGIDVEICREGYGKPGSVDIQVRANAGSANSPADYPLIPAGTTVSFGQDILRVPYNVKVVDDSATEEEETFMLELFNAQTGDVSATKGTTTICITDEDGTTYALVIPNVSVSEAPGNSVVEVCVVRYGYAGNVAKVSVITEGISAREGTDFGALNQELTFNSGDPMKCTQVIVYDDDEVESSETFEVALTESDNLGMLAPGVPSKITVTVTDNDGDIELVFRTFTVSEEEGGVTISARWTGIITQPETAVLTAVSDSAKLGDDFESIVGVLSFSPSSTTDELMVTIIDDEIGEGIERFFVRLFHTAGGIVIDEAVINIEDDDDDIIRFETSICSIGERAQQLTLDIRRYGKVNQVDNVEIATIAGTARSGTDYTSITEFITFEIGDERKQVFIQIDDDSQTDGDKVFMVQITNVDNGPILDSITCTIQDDDAEFALSTSRYQILESETYVRVIVTKSGNSGSTGSVDISTRDGTALRGTNYVAVDSRTLDFAIGETEKVVQIFIMEDGGQNLDSQKSFSVELSNPLSGIVVSPGIAEVLILEQQATYRIERLTYTVSEAAPSGSVLLVIIREMYDGITGTVDILTNDETATAPGDYTSVQTTLIFNVGQEREFVSIFIQEDDVPEETEVFKVSIVGATGGVPSITQSVAVITILDDDAPTGATVPSGPNGPTSPDDSGLSTAEIAGLAIGGTIAGIILLGLLGFVGMRLLTASQPVPPPPGVSPFQGYNNQFALSGYPGLMNGGYGGNFGNGTTFGNPAFQPNFFQQNGNQLYPQF